MMMDKKETGRVYYKVLLFFVVGIGLNVSVCANNVRLNGFVKVTDVTAGVATLELDLTWENSWRDNFNWDAVWLFLKYKSAGGEWSHVMLQDVVHTATNGCQVMNGKSGSNVVGVYVYPENQGAFRNVSTKVTLKWVCGTNYTKSSFDKNRVFLLAQAIEMVYIPFGAYYLGDGYSFNGLIGSDGNALAINGEGALTLYQRSADGSVTTAVSDLNANYPKGYNGFYVMKYETSQEQYVTFLNTLTRAEQESLLGASFLSDLSVGRYIFGDTLRPSSRNGIVLSAKPDGKPYLFAHNLNGNEVYDENEDGWCVACNYLSLNDLLAYASWSGLRPMSELEYERACRAPFPQEPQHGEYAWNTNSGLAAVTALTASGKENEAASGVANVNSHNSLGIVNAGPVRCGLFARSSSSQAMAGATYWGVMEMSGNVGELVANISNTGLSRSTNGSGAFNLATWSATPSHYGLRGGSFAGADSLLRTSDRTQVSGYLSSAAERISTVGFRLVRTLDAGNVVVNPGTISLEGPLCPGIASTVSETAPASISGVSGNYPISYTWSYSIDNGSSWVVIPGAIGNTLSYDDFTAGQTYLFKRTTICALGEASVQTTTGITAIASTAIVSLSQTEAVPCGILFSVSATGDALTYQWQQDGVDISEATAATYVANNDGEYRCRVSGTCGTVVSEPETISLSLPNDGILVDPRDNKRYKTRLMADGHVWMVEDLRFGTCNNSTFAAYYQGSVQNQIAEGYWGVCRFSTQAGAGYLYNWQAAMNSELAQYYTTGNPSGNVFSNSPIQWQGICPDGWHLPSGGQVGELQQLYTALGTTASRIYPGCSDFQGVLGGVCKGSSVIAAGEWGYCWSSTYYDIGYSTYLGFNNSGSVNPQSVEYKYRGHAVRCVKNY